MSLIYQVNEVLHRIRVRLYPSRLPEANGAFTARVSNEAVLDIEEVCASLVERGGFTGSYDDAVHCVRQYFKEAMYKLANGFAITNGFFTIQPSIGGFFESQHEEPDREKHPVRFHFRTLTTMDELASKVTVVVEKAPSASIELFTDMETGAVNSSVTPGGIFKLDGYKIKICGDSPDCGLYFVSTADPSVRIKAGGSFPENTSRKLIGRIPALPAGEYSLEIKTQYTVGGIYLKEPRSVVSSLTLNCRP